MPFYKFKLNGIIASEFEVMLFGNDNLITLKQVENHLAQAAGNDIEVDFSSIGGLIDVGTDIYFAFRDYKRNNPNAQMILNIKSQAASMASHIASGEFWDIVTVEDISSWMIHNPANFMKGDYRIMEANADYLKRLSTMFADSYSRRAKKSIKEIRVMMDETNGTWLFGKEIVDAGFADEVMTTAAKDEEKNRDSMFAKMQLKYNSTMEKIQHIKFKNDEIYKAVAKLQDNNAAINNNSTYPAGGGENKIQEEVNMTFDEAKKSFSPELANLEKAGIEKGKADMIANNKAIMEFKNKKEYKNLLFVQERCEEALATGENIADVKMSVQALMLDPKNQASMESLGHISSGVDGTVSGESDKVTENQAKW
jgi:ATP-dependent protease ClpP protease subunit